MFNIKTSYMARLKNDNQIACAEEMVYTFFVLQPVLTDEHHKGLFGLSRYRIVEYVCTSFKNFLEVKKALDQNKLKYEYTERKTSRLVFKRSLESFYEDETLPF